jgi:hypothetical protein
MNRDHIRIVHLLCGRTVQDRRGLPRQSYLRDNSADEKAARRALARYLSTSQPIDLGLRFILANLIDPDRDEINRRIRFENRRKGKPSNAQAEKLIAEFIWSMVQTGMKVESAVAHAMRTFGLGRSHVMKIWGHWQPILNA